MESFSRVLFSLQVWEKIYFLDVEVKGRENKRALSSKTFIGIYKNK
jgi:hypothetical protein